MKKIRKVSHETIIATLLVLVLAGLLNPLGILMLSQIQMMLVAVLAVLFFGFAGLIWKEKSADEREEVFKNRAGSYGYLAGLAVGVCGVVYQSFQHNIDPWLVYVLGAMILGKLSVHIIQKLQD